MKQTYRILAVNPGSTSTKAALFDNEDKIFSKTIDHASEDLAGFETIQAQLGYRREMVEQTMAQNGYDLDSVDVFVGRGGGIESVDVGVYAVTDKLVSDAAKGIPGQHPAQLASQICKQFGDKYGKPAYVVNPPDVDEFCDVARITGLKGVYRESHLHALNQKEIARRYCAEHGTRYEDVNLIVCHLGGGISITAHQKGRMIDSNDIIKGSGPMTPTRAGDLPFVTVLDMAYSGKYTKEQLVDKLNQKGGLTDHFGTADTRDVLKLANSGDAYAELVYHAMAYQSAKYAGAMAVALQGQVDAIILTGGIANGKPFTDLVTRYCDWIAEVVVMPGEYELEALVDGALRVVRGEIEANIYTGKPVWTA